MRLRQADLRDLRDKYERMLALREAHVRAKEDPAFIEPDPKPEMARLAERYPGALREIDRIPLEVIAERIRALDIAPADAEPWMLAQATFHRFARGALATKRWLAGRKTITPALRSAFARFSNADAKLFAGDLERIAAPPHGRLMNVVFAKVAAALGISEAEAKRLVFDS
jgi:hypothetical protein